MRHRVVSFTTGQLEGLEQRLAMSALGSPAPAIQMISATTTNSKSVTIDYQINQVPAPNLTKPIQFGIYRSSTGQSSASDSLVGTVTVAAPGTSTPGAITLDQNGQSALAVGTHQVTLPLPQGLPPFPDKPYVLVVANPGSATAASFSVQSASFRVYTIGIVTHGGIQNTSWKNGPPWQMDTAYMMRREGYDSVIAYNWVAQSSTPGAAIQQSPRLAQMILNAASTFPPNAPIDLQFIGHSEGTVVNAYALMALQTRMTPQLQAGYIQDILLDPHAANNNVPGQQMSFAGALGGLGNTIVKGYQTQAKDPPAYIPSIVDSASVFFQHSQAKPAAIYNLWGQVPVKSDGPVVHYYNLTAMGATHSGKTGVNYWFRDFIAPTLGNQAPVIQELQLNGQIDQAQAPTASSVSQDPLVQQADNAWANRVYGPAQVVQSHQPMFSGTSAPGSIIRLAISPATKPMEVKLAGLTTASNTGQWSLSTFHPLQNGQYRVLVTAFSRSFTTQPALKMVPTQPLGRMVVAAPPA